MKKILFFVFFLFVSLPLFSAEEILDYKSEILIQRNNVLTITDTITVRAEGKKIKRGIYREFPTNYKDNFGRKVKIRFEVISVERDGKPIHFWVERRTNGYRVYMGSKSQYLKPGVYTFKLTYRTDRQIGFFKDHDELYWNVNGCGWDFPIKKVTAYVSLPEGFSSDNFVKWTAYTGKRGSTAKFFKAYIDVNGKLVFETTKPLEPRECMTIVVAFKKGIVNEPTKTEKFQYFVSDNKSFFAGLIGLALVFAYFLIAWFYVGRDPQKGAIVPRFEPPENLPPAQIGYILKMGYTDRCLVAALVSMAVKGVIKIVEKDKVFHLERLKNDTSSLSPEEYELFKEWLKIGGYFKFKKTNHEKVRNGIKAFEDKLEKLLESKYFYSNTRYFLPGLVLSFLFFGIIAYFSEIPPFSGFIMLWLTGWSFGLYKIWKEFVRLLRDGSSITNTLGMFFSGIIFTLGEIAGLFMLSRSMPVETVAIVVIIVLLNIIFAYLLKAPTKYGRKVMDDIEGFRLYLSMAEDDYIKYKLKFTKDVNTFKWFLPYAIALGVEQKWSEKFEGAIDKAALQDSFEGSYYRHGMFSASAFSSSIVSSMSSSISSSSNPPGSSSGFSGGSAGGGGGGGGGGGF